MSSAQNTIKLFLGTLPQHFNTTKDGAIAGSDDNCSGQVGMAQRHLLLSWLTSHVSAAATVPSQGSASQLICL